MMKPNRFWIVCPEEKDPLNVDLLKRHATEAEAIKQATDSAKKFQGETFFVLKAVRAFHTAPPPVEEIGFATRSAKKQAPRATLGTG